MRRQTLPVGLLLLVACGGGGTDPAPPPPPPPPPPAAPVATIVLSPEVATVIAQATLQLAATTRDAAGNDLSGRPVTFTSGTPAVASVSGAGLVTGLTVGTAVIEATSGTATARATVSVFPALGAEATLRTGMVTLPAGSQIAPTSLQIRNAFGTSQVATTGAFQHLALTDGAQLAAAFASSNRPILLGWLSDDQPNPLTARSTAEVLAYIDLGAHFLPVAGREFVRRDLVGRSELDPLVAAITAALAVDPATATLAVASVTDARRTVQRRLLPLAQAASRRQGGGSRQTVQINPLATKSGIIVYESDLNIMTIRNQYRRRLVALMDRVSYVDAAGTSHSDTGRVARQQVSGVTGMTSFGGLLADVVLGNLAWAEVESDPLPAPVSPANARSTTYRLTVLGAGEAAASQRAGLRLKDRQKLDDVVAKTVVLDFVVPAVSNIILGIPAVGDAVDAALDSGFGAAALSDLLNWVAVNVPSVYTKVYDGDLRGAAEDIWTALLGSDTFQVLMFDLVQAIGSNYLSTVTQTNLGGVAAFGAELLKFVGKVDLIMTATDVALQVWQNSFSNGIETWDLTAVASKVAVNPPTSIIGPLDIQLLEAVVLGLGQLQGGAILSYKWTTAGAHGRLTDANNNGVTTITSSHDAVTYVPDGQTSGTETVTVEVTRIQAGTQPVVIGKATATIEVRSQVIGIDPDSVALEKGDQQTFTVTVPPGLAAGATLSYRWSTSGDFGTLDRGSKSFQTSSNKATYSAMSATRGWDDVAVEVIGTANGQTLTLGTDRAIVTIQRGPFTLLPASVATKVDSVVRFTARPYGDVPPNGRYLWQFGDNASAVSQPDSIASHSYAASGTYRVSVELQDATGRRVAVAGARVEVDVVPLDPVWRITYLELESLSGQVPHDSMAKQTSLVTYAEYFATRRTLGEIAAGREPAYLHALDGFTPLPDCFDFNVNGNKQEPLVWPAWIWIQLPRLITSWCGADRVLGHYPGDWAWVGTSITFGLHVKDYFQFQSPDAPGFGFDYPDPDFASVPTDITSGSITGRHYAAWSDPYGPTSDLATVKVVHEINAQLNGALLSGELRFIYRAFVGDSIVATWTAGYYFEATRGR